jgi:hypothetical protein
MDEDSNSAGQTDNRVRNSESAGENIAIAVERDFGFAIVPGKLVRLQEDVHCGKCTPEFSAQDFSQHGKLLFGCSSENQIKSSLASSAAQNAQQLLRTKKLDRRG